MAKCTYCDGEAWAEGYIEPAMCEKHAELAAVISWLEGNRKPVTFEMINLRLAL